MSYTIAIAGKGGTGKTTLATLIIYQLLKTGKSPILAVDADPNANLNEALGVEFERTVVDTVDEFMDGKEDMPVGVPKGRYLEYQVSDALMESKGFDLLVMGHTEGPGCYCYANTLLRGLLDKLSDSYPYVVMDNEAGMEHLSRRTTRDPDVLLITANPTIVALRSAKRIYEISQKLKLNVSKAFLIINALNQSAGLSVDERRKTKEGFSLSPLASHLSSLESSGLPLLGSIPYDEGVAERSIEAGMLLDLPKDSPAVEAVRGMMERLGV